MMKKQSFESNYKLARIKVPRDKCGRIMTALIDNLLTGVSHNIGMQHNVKLYMGKGDVNNRVAVGWIVGIGYEGDISKDRDSAKVRFDTLVYLPKVPDMSNIIEHVESNHYGIAFSTRTEEDNDAFKREDLESITIVCSNAVKNDTPPEPAKVVSVSADTVNQISFAVKSGTDMGLIMKMIESGMPVGEYCASKDELVEKLHRRSSSMISFQTIDIFNLGPIVKSLEKIPGPDDGYDRYMMTYLDDIKFGMIEVRPRLIGNMQESKYKALAIDVYSVDDSEPTDGTNPDVCLLWKDIYDKDYNPTADVEEDGVHVYKKSTFSTKEAFRIDDPDFQFTDLEKTYESFNKEALGYVFLTKEKYDEFLHKIGEGDVTEAFVPEDDSANAPAVWVHGIEFNSGSNELTIDYVGPETATFIPRYHGSFLAGFDVVLFKDEDEMNEWKEKYSI